MSSKYFIGVDIGGSSVKAVLVRDKKVVKSKIQDTPQNLEELLDLVVNLEDELTKDIEDTQIIGVGFAIPGAIDKERQVMLNSPNIKYINGQPLKKLFEERLKPLSIKIEHDVHCFLLAEKEIGLAKNFKDVFLLTLGTGIGNAWMVDGQIFFGAHGGGGDAGHMILDLSQGLEFEDLAADKFLKRQLGIGSIEVIKRAQAGDKAAQDVLAQLGKNLGVGLANIINIFDPEAIILAGGIVDAKEFLVAGIQEEIERYVVSPVAKETRILFSELGRFGGALGAALLFERR